MNGLIVHVRTSRHFSDLATPHPELRPLKNSFGRFMADTFLA